MTSLTHNFKVNDLGTFWLTDKKIKCDYKRETLFWYLRNSLIYDTHNDEILGQVDNFKGYINLNNFIFKNK